MKKIFKEPLLVFLLLGGAMFALYQQVSVGALSDNAEIVVTEKQIQALSLGFQKVWQRSPSEKELDGLIQSRIREEVFYREALAMGLDQDDGIVRRRMQQKLEFISQDLASFDVPDDQELQAYLAAHQEDYRQPTRFSFRQIYFDEGKRGQTAEADAKTLLATLGTQDADIANLSDSLMLKQQFNNETEREIKRILGFQFVQSLRDIPTGSWQGPIKSGYGLHLIYIDERIDGKLSDLKDVRKAVMRDWGTLNRKQANDAFYKAMRQRYKVTVENFKSESRPSEKTTKLSINRSSQ